MILGQLNRKQTLDIAMVVGKVLLMSGAETSRVEDTIERFCAKMGCYEVNVFVTPTVIVLGDEQPDGYSCVSRIRSRSTNLRTVSQVNDFLYNLDTWDKDYQGTMDYFNNKLKETPPYNDNLICLASGLASAGFSGMLGGNGHDFIAAFVTGLVAMLVLKLLGGYRPSAFWENALAGASIAAVAIMCCAISVQCTMDKIIVGAVMPFVPGVAFTNGLRDYMAGDLVSGNSRVAEAILFASSIAVGLAFVLQAWHKWGWNLW